MLLEERAYMAGIVDGEGSIGVRRRLRYITPILQVTNTRKDLLEWLVLRCGGAIYVNKEERDGRKQLYSWQTFGRKAQAIIREILPYLVIKRQQAELALTIRQFAMTGKIVMCAADFDRNDRIKARFHVLNRRGTRCP